MNIFDPKSPCLQRRPVSTKKGKWQEEKVQAYPVDQPTTNSENHFFHLILQEIVVMSLRTSYSAWVGSGKRGEIDVSRLMFIEALWQHPSTAVSCKETFPGLYTNRRTRMDTKLIDCQSEVHGSNSDLLHLQ